MKKVISVIILIALVFMLEFNFLEPLFKGAHKWVEPILAFMALIILLIWNDLLIKKK